MTAESRRLNIKLSEEVNCKLRELSKITRRQLTTIIEMGIELLWEKEMGGSNGN